MPAFGGVTGQAAAVIVAIAFLASARTAAMTQPPNEPPICTRSGQASTDPHIGQETPASQARSSQEQGTKEWHRRVGVTGDAGLRERSSAVKRQSRGGPL